MKRHPDYTSPALLVFGAAGLIATASGLASAPAWAWLVVLALAALRPLAAERARARRFDRSERRKNELAREDMRRERVEAQRDMDAMAKSIRRFRRQLRRFPAGELRALIQDHNAMVGDMNEMKRILAEVTQERERQRMAGMMGGVAE